MVFWVVPFSAKSISYSRNSEKGSKKEGTEIFDNKYNLFSYTQHKNTTSLCESDVVLCCGCGVVCCVVLHVSGNEVGGNVFPIHCNVELLALSADEGLGLLGNQFPIDFLVGEGSSQVGDHKGGGPEDLNIGSWGTAFYRWDGLLQFFGRSLGQHRLLLVGKRGGGKEYVKKRPK